MSGYTSGKTTHDRRAWIDVNGNRHSTYRAQLRKGQTLEAFYAKLGTVYQPRPEYDNHNPILVHLRGVQRTMGKKKSWKTAPFAASLIESIDNGWRHAAATPEHIDHARRVLSKLAALTTTPNGVTD